MASVDPVISVLYRNLDIQISFKIRSRYCAIAYYEMTHPLVTICYFACYLVNVQTVESKLLYFTILKSLGTKLYLDDTTDLVVVFCCTH